MAQQVGKRLQLIGDEVARWRSILEVPNQEYSLPRYKVGITQLFYLSIVFIVAEAER